jgi:hypothetical protein
MKYTKRFERILERIAERNHTTVSEVYKEMEDMIDLCWSSPDQITHARLVMIGGGKKPTPEQLVRFSAKVATKKGICEM